MEDVLKEDNFVARREKGTGDAIGTLRILLENTIRTNFGYRRGIVCVHQRLACGI